MTENLSPKGLNTIYHTENVSETANACEACKELETYKKLYYELFNHLTNVSNLIDQIQADSEELYISAEPRA